MRRRVGLAIALVGGLAAGAAWAQATQDATRAEVERAAAALWRHGGNQKPACLSLGILSVAEQQGVQELERRFAPGLWAVRIASAAGAQPIDAQRGDELRRLDYLARAGFLEKRAVRMTVGPIEGVAASEYRLTDNGWAISQGRPDTGAGCLYYGMRELNRFTGYTESEKDADGFSTLRIAFRSSAGQLLPWAASEEAQQLFPALRQALDGHDGSLTLYRGPDGKLRRSRDDKESLDEFVARRDATWPPRTPDESAIHAAIQALKRSPGPPPYQALPPACIALDAGSNPPLWQPGNDARLRAVRLDMGPASSTQRALALRTYGRLARLARAGLLKLRVTTEGHTLLLDVTPAPRVARLLAAHGSCIPVGDVEMQLLGVVPDDETGWGVRFKARYVVVRPERWVKAIKRRELLPDLVAWLDHGLYFDGKIYRTAAGWGAGYIVTSGPTPALPSLRSVGLSAMWPGMRATPPVSLADHQLETVHVQGSGSSQHQMEVKLRVRRAARPLAVLLTAYQPTRWKFSLDKGARIGAVVALGYHRQRIVGLPPDIPAVTAHSAGDEPRPDPAATQDAGLWEGGWQRLLGEPYAAVSAADGERIFLGGRSRH